MKKREYKYQQVYEEIVRCLRNGRYSVGDRLPSERELSRILNVNSVTVRRGYRELTLAGIVERKIGSGAYLRRALGEKPSEKPVTFAMDSDIGNLLQAFIDQIPTTMNEIGREYRFMFLDERRREEQIKSNISYGMPMIFFTSSREDFELMRQAPHLFAVMSHRADRFGIPSVLCDDRRGISLMVEHLRSLGHRRIALLHFNQVNPLGQIDFWREAIGDDYDSELQIGVDIKKGSLIDNVRQKVRESVDKVDFTALFTFCDELTMGAYAGLHDRGKRVPDDVAVVSIADSQLHRNLCPAVSVYDPDLPGHIRGAIALLEHNMSSPDNLKLLHLIEPTLFYRSSTIKE